MIIFDQAENQINYRQKDVLRKISRDAKNILEIGCWVGESTYILAESAKRNNGSICVVDWFKGFDNTKIGEYAKANNIMDIFINNMTELGLIDIIKIYNGKSSDCVGAFEDGQFDLIYIDAGHTYDHVISDIKNYFPKLKEDGIMCGHDFDGKEYDERYIDIDYYNNIHHGVVKAVRECFNKVYVESCIWRNKE